MTSFNWTTTKKHPIELRRHKKMEGVFRKKKSSGIRMIRVGSTVKWADGKEWADLIPLAHIKKPWPNRLCLHVALRTRW
jgi:hypothetical protein